MLASFRPMRRYFRSSRALTVLLIALVSAGAIGACGGESKEDKAKAQVCKARDDISAQIDTLKGLTVTPGSVGQVTDGVKAIGQDLDTIVKAESNLSDERRQQIQKANSEFSSTVQQIASDLSKTSSLSEVVNQFKSAVDKLAASYKNTFAEFSCS
jgi:uncharacterized phage infection (PIP) family protein YhgE